MECINALVCKRNFIFYDDRHRPLAWPAAGSVAPIHFFLFLPWRGRRQEARGGRRIGWGCSLINDWFVLAGLFHSSRKLDGMQILG